MQLLNSEETREIKGGGTCNKVGDTIYCVPGYNLVACRQFVAQCIAPFSSDCGITGFSITCNPVIL